ADPEGLKRQPPIVALSGLAPGRAHLILMAGPRPGRRHAGPRGGVPFQLPRTLPLVAAVLLAVPVGMAAAERQAAPDRLGAVGAGSIQPAEAADAVPEPPGPTRPVGGTPRRRAPPTVAAAGCVTRQQGPHAAP